MLAARGSTEVVQWSKAPYGEIESGVHPQFFMFKSLQLRRGVFRSNSVQSLITFYSMNDKLSISVVRGHSVKMSH